MHDDGLYAVAPGSSASEWEPQPLTYQGSFPDPTEAPLPRLQPVAPLSSPLFETGKYE